MNPDYQTHLKKYSHMLPHLYRILKNAGVRESQLIFILRDFELYLEATEMAENRSKNAEL